ncbi:hypothetical protein L1887_34862 [Cichorium endivia]|nr:hypothetical protein L1887_34862 [Cichorium endivia]
MTDAVHEESVVGESEEPPVNNYLGTPSDEVMTGCLPNARALEDTTLRSGRSFDKNPDLNIWAGPNSDFIPNGPLRNVDPSPPLEENARVMKRKTNRTQGRFNPYGGPTNRSSSHLASSIPAPNPDTTPSIDLNRNATCSMESSSSSTNEVEATTLVGRSIGFQVEPDCEALRNAVNGDGVIIGPQ